MTDAGSAERPAPTSTLVVPPTLAEVLRPHQIDALHFMWQRLVDDGMERVISLSQSAPLTERVRLYQEVFGCIIGHSMGLGKTVTVLSFLMLLQQHYTVRSGTPAPLMRVIVLTPRSCTYQWQCCAADWIQPTLVSGVSLPVYAPLGARGSEKILLDFYCNGGILLLGYEEYQKLLRRAKEGLLASPQYERVASVFDHFRPPLPLRSSVSLLDVLESPDFVILDESHRLKRVNSRLVEGLVEHLRGVQLRVALTGTPLQNHLEEYNVMHSVVTGTTVETAAFRRHFTTPIERGQCADSSLQQFVEMQKCVASLRRFFGMITHHCGPEILERELPVRREYIILVGLSPKQEEAYRAMVKNYVKDRGNNIILSLHHEASHVCFHPSLTLQHAREVVQSSQHQRPVFDTVGRDEVESKGNDEGGRSDAARSSSSFLSSSSSSLLLSSRDVSSDDDNDDTTAPAVDFNVSLEQFDLADSPKLLLTLSLLRHITEELKEKVVLFSTYRSHLFLLERLMQQQQQQRGVLTDVLHGGLDAKDRQRIIERFIEDPSRMILLCTTKASGVGINLVAANHCILFDVSWNPADDTQATYRLYRYGQKKPVTIYRIATDGTFEHVVFFYALSKSWLHKKIVDVADPTRYERHMKENYFIYPCRVPVDFERSDGKVEKRTPLPNNDAMQKYWKDYAARRCPSLLLTAADGTFAWIRSISEHSFLLRDNTEEVIREMGKRFDMRKPVANLPIVIEGPLTERDRRQNVPHSLLERCETTLLTSVCDCAGYLISKVQERKSNANEGEDKTMSSMETEKLLCGLFAAIMGIDEPAEGLAEIIAMLYHRGVDDMMRTILNKPMYAKLRAILSSRVVGQSDAGESLLNALCYKPFTLFSRIAPVEVTYTLTEMGLVRPFVPHCILLGLAMALRENKASKETLQTLCGLFASSDDKAVKDKLEVVEGDERFLIQCVESFWPLYEGMTLPDVLAADVEMKQQELTERAYRTALEKTNGFFSVTEAAKFLGIRAVHGRRDLYHCKRCPDGFMVRAPPPAVVLKCSRCHYNADFDLQMHTDTRQACILYQLSVICVLVDSFSTSRSLAVAFSPSACRDVLQVLRQLRRPQATDMPMNFVSDCVNMGIDILLSGLPATTVSRLHLQCGITSTAALKKVFRFDLSRVWSTVLRGHVRQSVTEWCKSAMAAGVKSQVTAMPEMVFVLGLQSLARGGGYASELLHAENNNNNNNNNKELQRGAAVMRFVCDGLVKLLYAERLMSGALTRASLAALGGDHAVRSDRSDASSVNRGRERRRGDEYSSDGRDSFCSSASVSIASVARRACARKRWRHSSSSYSRSTSFSGTNTSSSFNSCYSDDDGNDYNDNNEEEVEGRGGNPKIAADRARSELIESEEVLRLRSVQYWAAYCEVYGTSGIESMPVMVEDEENGMILLPPPPNSFWVGEMNRATREGMRLTTVVDEFLSKVMSLAGALHVIR